jgi:MarR family transcriptional regulator for hemolysin
MPGPDAGGNSTGPTTLSHEFGLRLVQMAHRWRRVLDESLRPTGLSQSTWRTLFHLAHMGDGILQKDLAIAIGIEGPSLVRLLDNLEKEGLIERRAAANDRRGKTLHLTALGRARHREVMAIADEVRAQLLEGNSEADIRTCLAVFDRLRANAESRIEENK